MDETKEVSFVTKRGILSSNLPIGIPLNGSVIMTHVVIVEYTESERGYSTNRTFRVLSLGDSRKLQRSYMITVDTLSSCVLTELTDEDQLA